MCATMDLSWLLRSPQVERLNPSPFSLAQAWVVARLQLSKCMMLLYHQTPRVTCVNPARRKGLSGVVECLSLQSWQLLAGGRMVTSDVWVTLRQSCYTAV
jgi:hypothetical protein